jgi:hypothetical protein
MSRSELFNKIIRLMSLRFSCIIKIKLRRGKIVWAKKEAEIKATTRKLEELVQAIL